MGIYIGEINVKPPNVAEGKYCLTTTFKPIKKFENNGNIVDIKDKEPVSKAIENDGDIAVWHDPEYDEQNDFIQYFQDADNRFAVHECTFPYEDGESHVVQRNSCWRFEEEFGPDARDVFPYITRINDQNADIEIIEKIKAAGWRVTQAVVGDDIEKVELGYGWILIREIPLRNDEAEIPGEVPAEIVEEQDAAEESEETVTQTADDKAGTEESEQANLEEFFDSMLSGLREELISQTFDFDGFIAEKLQEAAEKWVEAKKKTKEINQGKTPEPYEFKFASDNPELEKEEKEKLIKHLLNKFKEKRGYDDKYILNILICITQGFLTVFAGEPGCGKTSVCKILGDVLGLRDEAFSRYTKISVERGWTTKRDFIGYYNPLSKEFDKSNRKVYDALEKLSSEAENNREAENNNDEYPYLMLLDEANLSPMEYYWSCFMDACDRENDKAPCEISLSGEHDIKIPETLRFLATINNDHTTEELSPRLIDRAWIITMPEESSKPTVSTTTDNIIPWKALKKTFDSQGSDPLDDKFGIIKKQYEEIKSFLGNKQFPISRRVDKAITRYIRTAVEVFGMCQNPTSQSAAADENARNENPKTENPKIYYASLDYAVAQHILPMIHGSGEKFGDFLSELRVRCTNLEISCKIIDKMIERGKAQDDYYGFFY